MVRMAARAVSNWRVAEVVGLEVACLGAAGAPADVALRERVRAATAGLSGAAARRVGLRLWWQETGCGREAGRRFGQARSLVAALAGVVAAVAGAGVVTGIERAGGGAVHVVWFLALTLGVPWLFLFGALAGWLWAWRTGAATWLGRGVAWLLARWSGSGRWWEGGAELRRLASATVVRLLQGTAVLYHAAAAAGLAGLVMFRHVRFYWESTTETAMQQALGWLVGVLATPWAAWWPQAVPDPGWIAASRRIPGRELAALGGPWWQFLLLALVGWGVAPRLLLWLAAHWGERRLLAGLGFQSPACRRVWRELTAVHRGEVTTGLADGALVIDLGGCNPDRETLRPFLLRSLRVNPTAWETLGVLDAGREESARRALAAAPAGVVLVAEAWALSPRELAAAVARVRAAAGADARIVVLAGNPGPGGRLLPPTPDERLQWGRAVDALGDPALELACYQEVAP